MSSKYEDYIVVDTSVGKKVLFESSNSNDKIRFTKSIRWEVFKYYKISHLGRDILNLIWQETRGGLNSFLLTNETISLMIDRSVSKISQGITELNAIGIVYKEMHRKKSKTGKFFNSRELFVNKEMLNQLPFEAFLRIHQEVDKVQLESERKEAEKINKEVNSELKEEIPVFYYPEKFKTATEEEREEYKQSMIYCGLWKEGGKYEIR